MAKYGKKEISPNRHDWSPTPLPEQVVLVTSIDGDDKPHVATKTRITLISYGPPTILVFACRAEYKTAANVKEIKEFVVNVPGDNLVATSWVIGSQPGSSGPDLFSENGLTPIPSLKMKVPRIAECRAHLECEVDEIKEFGPDLLVFGRVVTASVNNYVLDPNEALAYQRLAPFFFLDGNRTAPLGTSRLVHEPVPGPRHNLTIIPTDDLNRAVDFYSTAFDWQVKVERPGYVEFELPRGRGLALCTRDVLLGYGVRAPEGPLGGQNGMVLHFLSENLPRTLARLVSVGAKELSELKERGDEESASFSDLDGNTLIVSRLLRAPKE